jgi:hypothetical protein
MCTSCKQARLRPEFEAIFHEYEKELYPESEWSNYFTKGKSYINPLFNWLSGTMAKSSPGYSKPSSIYQKPGANYTQPLSESQIVKYAITTGEHNENVLTDLLFFKRHPELGGKPLYSSMPNFATLSKEWLVIRDTIVRPSLQMPSAPVTAILQPGYSRGGTGKINLQNILNALTKKRYVIYTNPFQLNIVGIRANIATPDSFDDTINVFYKDNTGNWQFKSNQATTDPGLKVLMNPDEFNERGTGSAILIPDQYIGSHKIGLHHGSYTALVQTGGPVRVMRDFNKDNTLDFRSGREDPPDYYGINIHRATSSGTSLTVDDWSAGCQVFANSNDFAAFIQLCQQHKNLHGDSFTYTLLEEGDL